jgi:hypothetical protein
VRFPRRRVLPDIVHLRFVAAVVTASAWTVLGVSGCHHAVRSISLDEQASFRFVTPPPPPSTGKGDLIAAIGPSRDVVVDAQPIHPLAIPIYPAIARGANAGWVDVGVHVTVDPEGRVSSVTPSLNSFSIPGRFSGQFQAAVEAALAQWRFAPAEIKHLEQASGGEDKTYLRLASREKIPAAFDVVFTFTAAGEVRTGPARKTDR